MNRARHISASACLLVAFVCWGGAEARSQTPSPFNKLAGLWVGEGRLGARSGETEAVKCRVTYRPEQDGMALNQSIRCASAGGSIEVKVSAHMEDALIVGDWEETTHGWSGRLSGMPTDRGFRVGIKGENISANMDIIVINARQVVEIQFLEGMFIGLTLSLVRQGPDH